MLNSKKLQLTLVSQILFVVQKFSKDTYLSKENMPEDKRVVLVSKSNEVQCLISTIHARVSTMDVLLRYRYSGPVNILANYSFSKSLGMDNKRR